MLLHSKRNEYLVVGTREWSHKPLHAPVDLFHCDRQIGARYRANSEALNAGKIIPVLTIESYMSISDAFVQPQDRW